MRQDWWYDITETVCQTVTGSDISVAAAKDGGLAKVTVSGKGLLSGASITLPVGSLEDFVGQLGWGKRDLHDRAVEDDLGGAGLSVRDLDDRAVSVDLGDAGLSVRDFDGRAVNVDLGGAGLSVRDCDDRAISVDIGGAGLSARGLEDRQGVCAKTGGTMLTQTVCQIATGSDISVAAAKDGGLAKVTISEKGLLKGASITAPVGGLESVLGELGIGKRAIAVDLGGAGVSVRDLDERAVSVDLGGAGLDI